MKLSRPRQLEVLKALGLAYPRYTIDVVRKDHEEEDLANVWYLREHELVDAELIFSLSGAYIFQGAKITAKGIDFLADDGGLSAILGAVTVKLHADTIRELLISKVEQAFLPPAEKNRIRKHIETMSGEALKTMTKSLVEKGLERMPDLIQFVQSTVAGAA